MVRDLAQEVLVPAAALRRGKVHAGDEMYRFRMLDLWLNLSSATGSIHCNDS